MNTTPRSNPFVTDAEYAKMQKEWAKRDARSIASRKLPEFTPAPETTFEQRQNQREMVGRQAMLAKRTRRLKGLLQNNEDPRFIASQILLVQQTVDEMAKEGQAIDSRIIEILHTASNIVATRIAISKLLIVKPDLAIQQERGRSSRIGFA